MAGEDGKRASAEAALEAAFDDFYRRSLEIEYATMEFPAVFSRMPQLVRFALSHDFSSLASGEQKQVAEEMKELEDEGKPAKALVRYLIVRGHIKVGQFWATQIEDPADPYRIEMDTLKDRVPPSPYGEAEETMAKHLGREWQKKFASFNPIPFASASISDVHHAVLPGGEKVVIKLIPPTKEEKTKRSLNANTRMATGVKTRQSLFQLPIDPMELAGEFERIVSEELDLAREIKNARELAATLPEGIRIPKYYDSLSGEKILVMEEIFGVKVSELQDLPVKKRVAARIGQMLADQILLHGIIYADPHIANILVDPPTEEITLLDHGQMGRLTQDQRLRFASFLVALHGGEASFIAKTLEAMGNKTLSFNLVAFSEDVDKILRSGEQRNPLLIHRLFFSATRYGLKISQSYFAALKAVMVWNGEAKGLDPDFTFELFFIKSLTKLATGALKV